MDLAQRLSAKIDADLMAGFFGSISTAEPSPPPRAEDILESIRITLASVPPPPIFASSVDYPLDAFWQFEREGRDYVIGHPSLWSKIPPQAPSASSPIFGGLGSIPIRDTDLPSEGELRGKIRFAIATASHVPGRPVHWPRSVEVAPSVRARLRDSDGTPQRP